MKIYSDNNSLVNALPLEDFSGGKGILIIYHPENIEKTYLNNPVIYVNDNYDYNSIPLHRNLHLIGPEALDMEEITRIYNRFYGISNIIITTDRLIIREETLSDLPALYKVYDEDVCRFTEPLYSDYKAEEAFVREYIDNMYGLYGFGLWMVELKDSHELIGRVGLSLRDIDEAKSLELGYIIATPHQHKGYALESCRAIIKYAKDNTAYPYICAVCDETNIPSINLAKKLGFDIYAKSQATDQIILRYIL